MKLKSYRVSLVLYFLLSFFMTFPYWLKGDVIAPHRQFVELLAADSTGETLLENRKFSDFTNQYIPEISAHLEGKRSGWLTLWTNQNELGRPVYQISGFSPAYLPSYIISQFTRNPWQFVTVLSLLTCFLAGIFFILFCRELNLHPLAGLIAGTSLAASPVFMYWLTFPMFPSIWCWAAGALWAITRLARKPDFVGWSALAFSCYSLLMTAYPQPVVFNAYILGGYSLYLIYQQHQFRQSSISRFLVITLSAVITGIILALPVYIDLAKLSSESARVAPDPSFFTAVLPSFATLTEAVRFFVLSTIPELFANPVSSDFPFPYDGLSITLLVIFFAVIGLLASYKKTWGWWLAIAILFLFAFIHPLYVIGVKYLGFNLSRSTPLGSILLPLTIVVAHGANALIERNPTGKLSRSVGVAIACIFVVIAIGLGFSFYQGITVRWSIVLSLLVLAGLLTAQYRKTQPFLLLIALAMVLVSTSYPLMLRQAPDQIATTSPLVEKVRAHLPVGSRFAIATPGISFIQPNLNASLGLSSVHSYNSLSSTKYHTLIKALGGEMQTYGRWNGSISPNYNSPMFWMSNISLMLSPAQLSHENLEYLEKESGIYLYKVASRMGSSLQVLPPNIRMEADELDIADPRLLPRYSAPILSDLGDQLEVEVMPLEVPSVLVLSQKFHHNWQAQILVESGWQSTKTVVVNEVFQGVLLPGNIQRVRLEFKPWARYAWIAHVFWLLLLMVLLVTEWQKRRLQAEK